MVQLLKDDNNALVLRIEDLQTLVSAGFPNASDAMRKLKDDNVESLVASDSANWPPIDVVLTDKGYAVVDGYHRVKASVEKSQDTIRAVSKTYVDENAVLDAAFTANLSHGLEADTETRSRYVRWLHATYPEMTQEQLAAKAKVYQSTVSRALKVKDKDELDQAGETSEETVSEESEEITPLEELNKAVRKFIKAVHTFENVASDVETETEVVRILASQAKKDEDKEALEAIGNIMVKAAKHVAAPKKTASKKAAKTETVAKTETPDATTEKKPTKKQTAKYTQTEITA